MLECLEISNCEILLKDEVIASFDIKPDKEISEENRDLLRFTVSNSDNFKLRIEQINPLMVFWKKEVVENLEEKFNCKFSDETKEKLMELYCEWTYYEMQYRFGDSVKGANFGGPYPSVNNYTQLFYINYRLEKIEKEQFIKDFILDLKRFDKEFYLKLFDEIISQNF